MGMGNVRPLAAMAAFALATNGAFAGGPRPSDGGGNAVPIFTSHSPLIQIIDVNTGQNSLLLTGVAMDPNMEQTVRFVHSGGLPSFMIFQSIEGNPGEFRITADNLRTHIGESYFFDVVALDSVVPPQATPLSFAIWIVPEPVHFAVVAVGTGILVRRRLNQATVL